MKFNAAAQRDARLVPSPLSRPAGEGEPSNQTPLVRRSGRGVGGEGTKTGC